MRQVGTLQFQLGAVVEDESHLNLDKELSPVSPALEEVVPLYVQMVSVHFWVELTSLQFAMQGLWPRQRGTSGAHISCIHGTTDSFFSRYNKGY